MEPFLMQIAKAFYSREGAELKDYAFIFPNRRAGLFFRKYLSECAETPIFSPSIMTINDLFARLSTLMPVDRVQLLFRLYAVYKEVTATDETFDRFLFWGEIILNDFNDIDKFGADAQKLFSNLSDLRQLEADPLDYLSDLQLEAIRTFWGGFGEKGDDVSRYRADFLTFWQHLYPVYTRFREVLLAESTGYEGMITRQVAGQLQAGDYEWGLPFKKVVFVGFNALNRMEERLFTYLKKQGIGDFYWDYSSDWIKDPLNRAAFFMERNLANYPSQIELEEGALPVPEIEVYGVASAIAQAKAVANVLEGLYPADMPAEQAQWMDTAVVLPDENLLFPLLSSIPAQIGRVNVTMGYSLAKSPIAGLIDLVFELQRNMRHRGGRPEFYHKDILNLLNHRYLSFYQADVLRLKQEVVGNNRIFAESAMLQVNPLFSAVFRLAAEKTSLYAYLMAIIEQAASLLPQLLPDVDDDESADDAERMLEREFIDNYVALLNRFNLSQQEHGMEMADESYFKLLRKMVQSQSIPFQGEPLSGLQVMGMLETRVLDFKNLIVLSMNEGFFPLSSPANSLIPYNLRKGFGLPAYEHQDAVYAYHFYRFIQRAEKVFFFYDTRSDGLRSGEVSRYIRQLKYLYNVRFNEKLIAYTIGVVERPPLSVAKTPSVMKGLSAYLNGGERFLSASAINTYLGCPLRFYFQYVRLLKEEDEIQERVEANVFGSIFHKAMEYLYEPYEGREVTPDALKNIARDNHVLMSAIKRAFEQVVYHGREVKSLEGEHHLISEVIKRYVHKLLERDAALAPFEYLDSEMRLVGHIALNDGRLVNVKVLIDRVDRVAGNIRLVDYKTGKGEAVFNSIEQLFDKEDEKRPKEVLQLFLYSLVYFNEHERVDITPSLVFLRSLFDGDSRGVIAQKTGRGEAQAVTSFSPYREAFSEALGGCLSEIFDPSVPFTPIVNENSCKYCPFAVLCS